MTTRAPGLTAAMRKWAEVIASGGNPYAGTGPGFRNGKGARWTLYHNMKDRGLIDDVYRPKPTPRLVAALAAPRMTAAELQMMEWADAGKRIPTALMLTRAYESLWSKGWLEPDEAAGGKLTPAGLTALNNMRAAMGSAEWRSNEDV